MDGIGQDRLGKDSIGQFSIGQDKLGKQQHIHKLLRVFVTENQNHRSLL